MKLLKLEVQHFGCIGSATVELGPGLNVLFGPNDLGKSTLARAIRAALLLPHSSSAASAFAPWEGGESPEVVVTFQTGPARFHRVHKRFGEKGTSFLEESKDGLSFHTEKKAREVDGRLRELLRWGIRSPGGQGVPKGLPESFLSTVLLGEQANVTSILHQTLENDTDESGRARLTAALEAFAQDPLFKRILEEAQSKVDEAFSGTGKRKRGRDSPFTQVSEAVRAAKEELARLENELRLTDEAERRVRALTAERDRVAESRDEIQATLERVRELAMQAARRRALEDELAAAQGHFTRSQEQHDAVARLQAELVQLEQILMRTSAEVTTLEGQCAAAAAELERAKEALRLSGDEAAQQRMLARSQLDKSQAQLTTRVAELNGRLEVVKRGARLTMDLADSSGELERATADRDRVLVEQEALAGRRNDLTRLGSCLELAERLARLDEMRAQIAELESVGMEVEEDRRVAASKRGEARQLAESIPVGFPSPETVRTMEKSDELLRVAEAALGGGLSVRLLLREPLAIDARVDGALRVIDRTQEPVEINADRSLWLRLGEFAELEVSAGQKEARAGVERARERYEAEVGRPLSAWELPTLDALRDRVVEYERRRVEADRLLREADGLEKRAVDRSTRLAKLSDLRSEEARWHRELAEDALHDMARAALDEISRAAIGGKLAQTRRDLAATEQRMGAIRSKVTELQGHATTLEERCRATKAELGTVGPDPGAGWTAEEARLLEQIATARSEMNGVADALAGLDQKQNAAEQEADRAVAEAQRRLDALSDGLRARRDAHGTSSRQQAGVRGQLEILQPQLALVDLEADRRRVSELEERIALESAPERTITEHDLAQVEADFDEADGAVRSHELELQKAKGALETVGGDVVKERVEQAREALLRAQRNERDVDIEYGAWQLLVDKLREAESTEGKHLGEALSVPVTKQFESLTSHRYGKLQLDPGLAAEGILAAGKLREIAALSVGTQEQLAALLRLTIAEHLGSMLVLDDQLTQTDPVRSAWFQTVLRDRAVNIQVVVLTCRPNAYVGADELPSDGEILRDRAAGLVRAIDLVNVIRRGSIAAAPLALATK